MSESQLAPAQTVEAVYGFAAQQMANGVSREAIEKNLMEQGLDAETAATVVKDVKQARTKVLRAAGVRNMVCGAVVCIVGAAVTALTYAMASSGSGGGHYVIAWGAIVFGGIQCFRGMIQAAMNLL